VEVRITPEPVFPSFLDTLPHLGRSRICTRFSHLLTLAERKLNVKFFTPFT
jgi:hypothetical protein